MKETLISVSGECAMTRLKEGRRWWRGSRWLVSTTATHLQLVSLVTCLLLPVPAYGESVSQIEDDKLFVFSLVTVFNGKKPAMCPKQADLVMTLVRNICGVPIKILSVKL